MNIAKFPKADVHVHVGKGNPLVDSGIECTGISTAPENLIKEMDKYNIKKSVILGIDIPGNIVSNEYVVGLQDKYPDRLIACVCINPMNHADFGVSEMKKYVKKVKALKLMPPYQFFHVNDKRIYPLYNLLEENNIVLIVHTGTTDWPTAKLEYCRPLEIDTVAVDFPKLKILMAHSGDPWFGETRDILYKNKNVYADISGIILETDTGRGIKNLHKFFDEFLWQFPSDRLLFGTDWPFTSFGSYMKSIEKYKISKKTLKVLKIKEEELWKKLFYENAKELFSFKD